jgi:hypothetical protein
MSLPPPVMPPAPVTSAAPSTSSRVSDLRTEAPTPKADEQAASCRADSFADEHGPVHHVERVDRNVGNRHA